MLTAQENELLTRVGPGTPMGALMRRYWLPAAAASELRFGGEPRPVRLLGEDLLALRDGDGRVRVGAYPAREHGGLVWAYLGPAGTEPPLPDYGWTTLSDRQRVVVRVVLRANYAQGMEGSLDSAHSWFLHRGAVRDWQTRSSVSSDLAPRLEAEDTPTGFRYAAIRRVDAHPDTQRYVRITTFVAPFNIFIPPPLPPHIPAHIQMFVPRDDESTTFIGVWFSRNGEPVDPEPVLAELGMRPGLDFDENGFRFRRPENRWNQDRAAMNGDSYVGIDGVLQQDFAAQESQGPIVDRTREHLGTSDVAVIRMRRRMLGALEDYRERGAVLGAGHSYAALRAEQQVVPIDMPWTEVGKVPAG